MVDTGLGVGRRTFVKGAGATLGAGTLGAAGAASDEGEAKRATERPKDDGREGDDEMDGPTTIAHRGYAGQYPENTLGAFEAASMHETTAGIELDVVPTKDGEVVTFHDSKLNGRDGGQRGLTDLDGYVWEREWEVVRDAEVLGSGETVPRLSSALEAIPSDVFVNVEFKNPGSTDLRFAQNLRGDVLEAQVDLWLPFAQKVLNIAAVADNDVLVSSFYEAALAAVRRLDPSLPVAFLFWDSVETGLKITREYDCEALHPPWNMIRDTPFFGDDYYTSGPFAEVDLVEWAHRRGKTVNAWTVGTWYQTAELADAGVDGIITDYPTLPLNRGVGSGGFGDE